MKVIELTKIAEDVVARIEALIPFKPNATDGGTAVHFDYNHFSHNGQTEWTIYFHTPTGQCHMMKMDDVEAWFTHYKILFRKFTLN